MKKRLRKKLHKGEFQELGFRVAVRMNEDLTSEVRDNFLDAFILQAVETNGLLFGDGTDGLELRGS